MLCQNCGKNEVNFRYTQIVNGVKKEMALCDKCAKKLGLYTIVASIRGNYPGFSLADEVPPASVQSHPLPHH